MYRICLLCLFLVIPVELTGQQSFCDPHLGSSEDHPYGYRSVGDRCEGVYIRQVGSTSLHVASLTAFFDDYDLTSGAMLLVDWVSPAEEPIHLRAHGLRSKLYYRMDTVRTPATAPYEWPSNILAALSITRGELGVVGWIERGAGEAMRRIYVPLRIHQDAQNIQGNDYQVVLIPGRELVELYVSLARAGTDDDSLFFIRDGEPLQYGYYPAYRAVTIPVTGLEAPGVYFMEFGASFRGGGVASRELWFYHGKE